MKEWLLKFAVGKIGPSWRTSILGLMLIFTAIGSAGVALLDNDPNTKFNWEVTSTAVMTGVGLIVARDNKTTSEQVLGNKGVLPEGVQKPE